MLRRSSRIAAYLVLPLLFFFSSISSHAEPSPAPAASQVASVQAYRIQPGDILEIAAAGVSEYRHRVTVGIDGYVSVPLGRPVAVSGLSLPEAMAKIQEPLTAKVFRRRGDDGRETAIVLSPDEISVTIAEYRPVYVSGDVSRPGEQPYRPGLTVRSAVAVAGGYDVARFRMENPFLALTELRTEHDSLWAEYTQAQARVLRLRAELSGKSSFDDKSLLDVPIPAATVRQLSKLEAEQLTAREADLQKEKAYLQSAIKQESGRAQTLTQQQRQEREGTQEDVADFNRLKELYQKGAIPITRLTEARRSVLLSSTRVLQAEAQLAQVERETSELGRKLQRTDDQRRLNLLQELQAEELKVATIRTRIDGVTEKLRYTGIVRSQLVRGDGSKPDIVVVRPGAGGIRERIKANEDQDLLPGDIVEISLRSEMLAGAPSQ